MVRLKKSKLGLSKNIIIVFVSIILVIIVLTAVLYMLPTIKTKYITLGPSNPNILVDVAQVYPSCPLDPATSFAPQDLPFFTAVFQGLVEFNGSNYNEIVPVIAKNYTILNNYKTYIFYLRPCVHFADGVQVNASTVWFSFYRMIVMGQGPGVANYLNILFNCTIYSDYGVAIPWGVCYAIENATGLNTVGNYTLTAEVLAYILSHFNANNATIQKIMSYPNQAVVVLNTYEVEINLLEPYKFFLDDIASWWWGDIVNPVCVDMHGGVQVNQPNCYLNSHGMNGTGPYVIVKVNYPSCIELEANPNYWAIGKSVPSIAQPAHIKYVIIKFGLVHNERLEEFLTNKAQISYISIPYLSQVFTTSPYNILPENCTLRCVSLAMKVKYISMNMDKFPTNNTCFRLAVVHAINYTQILQIFSYNNKIYAEQVLGPIIPQFKQYYNPAGLQMYCYNPQLAMKYLEKAGEECHFYVVLPNGSVLGDPNGRELPPITIYGLAPVSLLEQDELKIVQQDLEQIGISTNVQYVLPVVTNSWTTPNSTPNMVFMGWFPDYPDPVYQLLIDLTDVKFGGSLGNFAWVNISCLQSMYSYLPFITNTSLQVSLVSKVYNIIYKYAPYLWLPTPDNYYLVQPYLKGFVYNPFSGYFYNMMYYCPVKIKESTLIILPFQDILISEVKL